MDFVRLEKLGEINEADGRMKEILKFLPLFIKR